MLRPNSARDGATTTSDNFAAPSSLLALVISYLAIDYEKQATPLCHFFLSAYLPSNERQDSSPLPCFRSQIEENVQCTPLYGVYAVLLILSNTQSTTNPKTLRFLIHAGDYASTFLFLTISPISQLTQVPTHTAQLIKEPTSAAHSCPP